jgi:SAM-dependent methyltransferase
MSDPISRFSGKAHAYASGRPIYPTETLNQIVETTNLPQSAAVFDLGAGTGLFTQLLLNHFNQVTLIEPNNDMATTAKDRLPLDRITIQNEPAESFNADPHSIDLITAAQAFHWFNQTTAKAHWKKCLKPEGYAALIWNERTTETAFAQEVTDLLSHMAKRDPQNPPPQEGSDEEILGFFEHAEIKTTTHSTPLTEQELINLVLSRSYAPNSNDTDYKSVINQVKNIYTTYKVNNSVELPYQTKVFIGQI